MRQKISSNYDIKFKWNFDLFFRPTTRWTVLSESKSWNRSWRAWRHRKVSTFTFPTRWRHRTTPASSAQSRWTPPHRPSQPETSTSSRSTRPSRKSKNKQVQNRFRTKPVKPKEVHLIGSCVIGCFSWKSFLFWNSLKLQPSNLLLNLVRSELWYMKAF